MAILVMVYGQSGTGKSTSLRNFNPDEVAVINVSGKPMPFRTKLQTYNTDDYNKILNAVDKAQNLVNEAGEKIGEGLVSIIGG